MNIRYLVVAVLMVACADYEEGEPDDSATSALQPNAKVPPTAPVAKIPDAKRSDYVGAQLGEGTEAIVYQDLKNESGAIRIRKRPTKEPEALAFLERLKLLASFGGPKLLDPPLVRFEDGSYGHRTTKVEGKDAAHLVDDKQITAAQKVALRDQIQVILKNMKAARYVDSDWQFMYTTKPMPLVTPIDPGRLRKLEKGEDWHKIMSGPIDLASERLGLPIVVK